MSREATLTYSETLVRQAVFAFWRRTVGVRFAVVAVLASAALAVLLADGDRSWRVGALAAVLAVAVAMAIAVYRVHYRNSMRMFRELGDSPAHFRADEASFTVTSAVGTATLQWSAVKELWRFPGVWLLLYSKSQFSTLPVGCLSPELQAYVLQRVSASGGKISG